MSGVRVVLFGTPARGGNDAPLQDARYAALDHLAQRVVTVAGKLKG